MAPARATRIRRNRGAGTPERRELPDAPAPRRPDALPAPALLPLLGLCALLFLGPARAIAGPDHVTLQLKWYPQFQFAGYYMADARGFFREENLDVTIRPGTATVSPTDEVDTGRAQFGVGAIEVLMRRSQGRPFVSLAAVFQHSAVALAVREESPIRSFNDLAGCTMAGTPGSPDDAEIRAVLKAEGVDPARVRYAPLTFSLEPFVRRQVDARSVYITNEPDLLRRRGIEVRLLRAINYGVDFYGDILFTTEGMVRLKPDVVARFRRACIRGWRYALDHPGEAVAVVQRQPAPFPLDADHLLFEALQTRNLIQPDIVEIGHQSSERWEHIQSLLRQQGLITSPVDLERFVWQDPSIVLDHALAARLRQVVYVLALLALCVLFYAAWNAQLRRAIRLKSAALLAAQKDLETRGRALHSLLELGYTLSASANTDAMMEQIIRYVRLGTGSGRVGVYLTDENAGELQGTVSEPSTDPGADGFCRVRASLRDRGDPMAQVALGEREFAMVEKADPSGAVQGGARYYACVPLKASGRVIGVLSVDPRADSRSFDDADMRQLRGFADEIALALYNTQLLREAEESRERLERSNRELQALVAFSRSAGTARTPHEVVRHIANTVRRNFGYDRVGVFLVEGDELRGVIGTDEQGQDEDASDQRWPLRGGDSWEQWTTAVIGNLEYAYTPDAFRDYGFRTQGGKPVHHHILLPLRTYDRIVGAVAVDNGITDRPFGESEAHSLVAFARHAATALDNVRLMDALRGSEERMRALVSSLSETIYSAKIRDGRLCIIYVSPQVELLTGYTPEEVLEEGDRFWERLAYPEDRARVIAMVPATLKGEPLTMEYRIVHKNGEVRWVIDSPAPIRNEQGLVTQINGTVIDVTERHRLEEQVRHAQKMETIGTLAGGIAHDFNNLLAIINGNIELAQMDIDPDSSAGHSLAQTQRAVQRAASLTQQLLTFSRKTESARRDVTVNEIVEETAPLLLPSLGPNITLDIRPDPDPAEIHADPGQLQQVLINLCMNARDAMPEGGRITVRIQNVRVREADRIRPAGAPPGDYVRVQVMDTGLGMDAATRERIFEPFFTTKPIGRGTGLGLAVAYAIVEDHQGWIHVDTEPGSGTVFSIYLPAAGGEREARPAPAIPARQATILIVDPDPTARENLAGMLDRHGYYTLTAADGSEALAVYWAEADRVALVLCAQRLPDMDASHLVRHLRNYDADVPVLLTRERAAAPAPARPGADDALLKPYREDEVLSLIHAALVDGRP